MKNYLTIFILCLFINQLTIGQAVWQQYQGPYTGDIYSFTSKGDTIYAGAKISGVFRSTDLGRSWQSTGLKEGNVYSMLAVGSKLMACGEGYLFISKDNGLNWSNPKIMKGRINKFFSFRSQIYLGTTEGVYIYDPVSNDTLLKNNGLGSQIVQSFINIDTILFCGTFNDGLFSSRNKGETWQKISSSSGLNLYGVKSLLNYRDTLIAADYSNSMIFQSGDSGKSWINISSGLTHNSLYNDIVIFNDTIVLATSDGVYRFDKKALTWKIISNEAFSTLFVNDSILLASNKYGVYRYNKNDKSFELSNSGINTAKVLDLALFNSKLYAATESGVFSTSDDGRSWANISETKGLYCHTIGHNDTMLFLGTNHGIFSTSIHSNTWNTSNSGLTSKVVWDIESDRNILFAATDSGPFISKNSGKSWSPVTKGFSHIFAPNGTIQYQALAIASGNGMVLASNNFGLYKLSHDSTKWDLVGFQDEGGQMLRIIDNTVYFCKGSGGLYKSTDTCKTWISLNNGFSYPQFPLIYDIFKRGDKNLYASGIRNIYYSADKGKNWDNWFETGMPDLYIYRVIQGDSALYAGTYGKSIWKRNYLKINDCSSSKYNISGYGITNIPSNTPADSLTANLKLAHGANAVIAITTKAGSSYVKTGDKVIVTAEDGITSNSYVIQVITAISTKEETNLILYPSPAKDKINFSDSNEIEEIVVYNIQGAILLNSKIINNSIDVSKLKAGTYVLSIIKKDNQRINMKFVKE